MTPTLYVYTAEGQDLGTALATAVPVLCSNETEAIALVYTPQWCGFCVVANDGKRMARPGDQGVDLDQVFEIRVFSPKGELRWLHGTSGPNRTALLAPDDQAGLLQVQGGWKQAPPIAAVACIEQTYLLWGEGMDPASAAGWSRLATARIGTLDVPVPGATKTGQRVRLKTMEYLGEYEHGNVAVCEERLIGLEVNHA